MYKILTSPETQQITGLKKENTFIPIEPANNDYQQFIKDVAEQGIGIVEGPDVVEPSYVELRVSEYPSREDQLDMMYWDKVNGTTTWEDTIQSIKDKHPKTITGGTTIGEVPDWVQEAADNWTFNKQLHEYVDAVERLEHYVLSEGVPEITETSIISTELVLNEETNEYETKNITEEYVVQKAIKPLEETIEVTSTDDITKEETIETIPNPLIVKDEEERAAAQAVIDATPQSVIDSINN